MQQRVDFYPVEQFDRLVETKGFPVLWQEATFCYCVDSLSSQPNYDCPICKGLGFIYSSGVETVVAMTNIQGKQDFLANIGIVERGTAYVTTLSKDLMGYHDRLTFTDFNSKYSQLLKLEENGVTESTHKKVKRVLNLFSEGCPEGGWVSGTHFKVSEDGWSIEWLDDSTLADVIGKRLSILYVTSPSYLISDVIHELRATYVQFKRPVPAIDELPKQFVATREDFAYVNR